MIFHVRLYLFFLVPCVSPLFLDPSFLSLASRELLLHVFLFGFCQPFAASPILVLDVPDRTIPLGALAIMKPHMRWRPKAQHAPATVSRHLVEAEGKAQPRHLEKAEVQGSGAMEEDHGDLGNGAEEWRAVRNFLEEVEDHGQ